MPRLEGRVKVPGMDFTTHYWVYDLLEKETKIEEALGLPLGKLLGCGLFGCVMDTEGPWVIKITLDKDEAPMWQAIHRIAETAERKTGHWPAGAPRVLDIGELKPGLELSPGKEQRVYVIIREEAAPLFSAMEQYADPVLSEETALLMDVPERSVEEFRQSVSRYVGADPARVREWVYDELMENPAYRLSKGRATAMAANAGELSETMELLGQYHTVGRQARAMFEGLIEDEGYDKKEAQRAVRSHFRRRVIEIAKQMSGVFGESLGRLFELLVDDGIILADAHIGNFGWRVHECIDGSCLPQSLMMIDPGATPTADVDPVEVKMIANARWRA